MYIQHNLSRLRGHPIHFLFYGENISGSQIGKCQFSNFTIVVWTVCWSSYEGNGQHYNFKPGGNGIIIVFLPGFRAWSFKANIDSLLKCANSFKLFAFVFFSFQTVEVLCLKMLESMSLVTISQFSNSVCDALWDGVTGDIMHKPNGDIPRNLWHNFELPNWLICDPVQQRYILSARFILRYEQNSVQNMKKYIGKLVNVKSSVRYCKKKSQSFHM